MSASLDKYKGRPVLCLRQSDEDKFPFSFGLKKAEMILDHLEDIKKFVAENKQKE